MAICVIFIRKKTNDNTVEVVTSPTVDSCMNGEEGSLLATRIACWPCSWTVGLVSWPH